jgi:hypothetical protein
MRRRHRSRWIASSRLNSQSPGCYSVDRTGDATRPTSIQTICARLRAGSATVGDGNHWPKHWPDAAPAVHCCRNALKSLVGPGGMPQHSNINGLRLQTFVSARIGTKGVLGAVTNRSLIAPAPTVGGAKHHDFARRQIAGESKPQQKSRKSSGPHALPCTLTAATTARAISRSSRRKPRSGPRTPRLFDLLGRPLSGVSGRSARNEQPVSPFQGGDP